MTTTTTVNETSSWHNAAQALSQRGAFERSLGDFVAKSDNLANEILGSQSTGSHGGGQTVIIRDSGPSWWWMYWFGPRHVNSANTCAPAAVSPSSHKKDKEYDGIVAVVALAALAFTLVGLGSAMGRRADASQGLEETETFKNELDRQALRKETTPAKGERIGEASHLASLKEKIHARNQSSATKDLFIRTFFGLGTASVAGGWYLETEAAMQAGLVTSLVSGGAMLLKWGFDDTDRQNRGDALAIRNSIYRLHHAVA